MGVDFSRPPPVPPSHRYNHIVGQTKFMRYRNPSGELLSGRARYRFSNGAFYLGEWQLGLKHGHGNYIHPNGESYVGQFHEGHMQGRGLYKYARGTYEGDWLADKKHGHGVYRFADGDWYDGQFVNDQWHGEGTYKFHSGERFEGTHRWNQRIRGTYYHTNDVVDLQQYSTRLENGPIGEGVRWSADREHAWKLRDGMPVVDAGGMKEITLAAARQIGGTLCLQVPERRAMMRFRRLRRHALLVGRWRLFFVRMYDEIHFRPGGLGEKQARMEFESCILLLAEKELKRVAL